MTELFLIRHATTEWNVARRLQGKADIALTAKGRKEASTWKLSLQNRILWSSPLIRAVETASIMFGEIPRQEDALIEMDCHTLNELRIKNDHVMKLNENRGLHMQPDGGESPYEVQQRLLPWLNNLEKFGNTHIAITHKGVIRAIFALATGWDMTVKPPINIDMGYAYSFTGSFPNPIIFNKVIKL